MNFLSKYVFPFRSMTLTPKKFFYFPEKRTGAVQRNVNNDKITNNYNIL